jgi:hypothetical protein
MNDKPMLIELELDADDVEAVINEYQAANPGKAWRDMTGEEFADRLMKKIAATGIRATATVIEGGNA